MDVDNFVHLMEKPLQGEMEEIIKQQIDEK